MTHHRGPLSVLKAHRIQCGLWFYSLLVFCAPTASAQITYGADVTWNSRYEWRGLTMRDGMVLQPDFYLSAGDRYSLTLGGWTSVELTTPGVDEFGYGNTFFGESNVWAELATNFDFVDVAIGWNWYRWDSQRTGHVPVGTFDTSELYGRLQLLNLPVVVPRVEYFQDIDKAKGGFIETSMTLRVPLWTQVKAPVGSILLTGATGYNISQDSILGAERFRDSGFKYAQLTASTVTGYMPISLFGAISAQVAFTAGFHLQFNLDSSTKNTFTGASRSRDTWWTVGLQWFGPRCEPTRSICG